LPVTHWSHHLLTFHLCDTGLTISERSVGRILASADLQPHRQRRWMTSQDEDFRAKRDDVLRVYYDTPADEHIICLDEKPNMQALERRYRDLPMAPGQPVRREWEYIRHGTLTLMGAFDVRRGQLFGFCAERRGGDVFVELLEMVDALYPTGRGHIICDNLSDHDTEEVREWFEAHPRWTRHFTPTHASWLNQIEGAFGLLQRRVLARGSFTSRQDLATKVLDYMAWHTDIDAPFRWKYRPASWDRIPARTSGARH
jgi:transposase